MSSSGSESGMRSPLMNSVVLTRLFELCKLSDLLGYRLVCKEWYAASEARIRSEMFVKITSDPKGVLNWSNLDTKLDIDGAPFRCFKLHGMDFISPPSSQSTEPQPPKCSSATTALAKATNTSIDKIRQNMARLWEEHGQFMHKLNLADFSVFSVEAFKKALFEQTPNLEELEMEYVDCRAEQTAPGNMENDDMGRTQENLKSLQIYSREYVNRKIFPIEWKHIFLQFPKIEKFSLCVSSAEVIIALHNICESRDKIPIKELVLTKLTADLATRLKNLLQLPKLKLSKLVMDVGGCEDEERGILQVALRTHGSTLKELLIGSSIHDPDPDPISIQYDHSKPGNNFPFQPDTLEQLTHLDLTGSVFHTFRFLKQTPNLKVLYVSMPDPNAVDFKVLRRDLKIMMNTTRLPFLNEFRYDGRCLREREVEVLVKVMPNVEHFAGEIDGSALRVICKNWRKLKVLELQNATDIDDEAFTGIKDGYGPRRHPNITDLKVLWKLKISEAMDIGDFSIRTTILTMSHLRSVCAELSSETSQKAMDALRKQFPLGKFRRCFD